MVMIGSIYLVHLFITSKGLKIGLPKLQHMTTTMTMIWSWLWFQKVKRSISQNY